jgi:hypothetical protein
MSRALRFSGAVFPVLAAIWVGGVAGVDLRPGAAVATAALVVAAVLLRLRRGGVALDAPRLWLGALVAWLAVTAAAQPVAPGPAAYLVAVAAVAWGLALLVADWRSRAWATAAVALLGACSGLALIGGRLVEGVRSDGLFGNPNLSATVALLGLASAPFVRLPGIARLALATPALAGIVASGSRASMLATGALATVWLLTSAPRRGVRLAVLGVLAIGAAGLSLRIATDHDPLRFERVRIWGVALRVTLHHLPWGTGPSGFADRAVAFNFPRERAFARFARVPDLAESDALQLAATQGLPGVALAGGLLLVLLRSLRKAGPHGWGCAAALAMSSAFHTQLPFPVLAWTATLALGAALPCTRRVRARAPGGTHLAVGIAATSVLAMALIRPEGWLGGDPDGFLATANAMAVSQPHHGPLLADAEALAVRAVTLRPHWGLGWRTVGQLRAQRALGTDNHALWSAAREAFREARGRNPLDAFAALGEGRTSRELGEMAQARGALRAAVALEPNLVGGWLELALIAAEEGRIEPARRAHANAVRALTAKTGQGTAYEQALQALDPHTAQRVRAALRDRP